MNSDTKIADVPGIASNGGLMQHPAFDKPPLRIKPFYETHTQNKEYYSAEYPEATLPGGALTQKTFVHHDGALGDTLVSLPCIRIIRGDSGFIHMAGHPGAMELLRDTGCVDDVSSVARCLYVSLYSPNPEARVREFIGQFDRAFVFTARNDSILAANIEMVIPYTKIILTIPPEGIRVHVAEFRMKQLACEIGRCNPLTKLDIPAAYKEKANELLTHSCYTNDRPLLALHPGSGGKKKCWPLRKYFELAERVRRDRDPFIIFFSGPAEDSGMKNEIGNFARGHKDIIHICDRELATVAALLSLCSLYIGNDSAVTHLAGAVAGSVIALFGPTDPILWKPSGNGVEVISAGFPRGSLSAITVKEVFEKAAAQFSGSGSSMGSE